MSEDKFWQLIQVAHDQSCGDMDRKCESIKAAIKSLSSEDANNFSSTFDDMMDKAYAWSLLGAAYVMHGGCGDDTFTDFRSSLISRGKQSFYNAISDPDSLASDDFDDEVWFYEGFQYAVTESVEAVVGTMPLRNKAHPEAPSGTPWEEGPEELKAKYPNLWAAFEHVWSASSQSAQEESKPWWKFW